MPNHHSRPLTIVLRLVFLAMEPPFKDIEWRSASALTAAKQLLLNARDALQSFGFIVLIEGSPEATSALARRGLSAWASVSSIADMTIDVAVVDRGGPGPLVPVPVVSAMAVNSHRILLVQVSDEEGGADVLQETVLEACRRSGSMHPREWTDLDSLVCRIRREVTILMLTGVPLGPVDLETNAPAAYIWISTPRLDAEF